MSYSIETLNRGRNDEFGFFGPDVNRVRLGDLPPMNFFQFCTCATISLIISLEGATQTEREKIAKIVDWAILRVKDAKVRPTKTVVNPSRLQQVGGKALFACSSEDISLTAQEVFLPVDFYEEIKKAQAVGDEDRLCDLQDELLNAINVANGQEAKDFLVNPFKIRGSRICIGDMYEVNLVEFACFEADIMTGGFAGWESRGIPEEAKINLQKLAESVKIMAKT